ncbi:MAG: 23S rRNA (uracil-C(5))-methyltransferase RlmCD [Elusimicrobia bacterium]|nr:23S rRNA (uracil-C(5))-methyltransferase RlmCD [Elusimicrobiota bacterium]
MPELCAHFGLCGGCSQQNVPYADQLSGKEAVVRSHLKEIPVKDFCSILPSPDIFYYRNKMEFSFGNEKDLEILGRPSPQPGVHLGLHPKGRFALVTPTPQCLLLSPEAQEICSLVETWATKHKISVYVRKNGQGNLRHLVIREAKSSKERMVNLFAKSATEQVDALAEDLKNSGIPITTFLWTRNDGLSDVARGNHQQIFWGEGMITESVGALRFKISPDSFMQTNTRAAEMMLEVLREWIEIGHGQTLIDLYCGSGAIGLSLSKSFDEVIGIEINKRAVEDAWKNADLNGISNARFLEGKAEELAASLPVKDKASQTTVVVDPPRAGLHSKVIQTLLDWQAPQLFYVSCNPETLARDLKDLSTRYDILAAQPMDFFPHTDHVETAVRMKLKK